MDDYAVNYPIPDLQTPPTDPRDLVTQIMQEALFNVFPLESWTWEHTPFAGGPIWFLTLLPIVDPTRPRMFAIFERAVVAEEDPAKALVLAWRYRGRKKETMRALADLPWAHHASR